LLDGAILADGAVRIEDVRRKVGISIEESPDYATIAGFILASLNTIPSVGTMMVRDGYRWTILEVDGPRIAKVKIEPMRSPQS
jgi:putative hemolysin